MRIAVEHHDQRAVIEHPVGPRHAIDPHADRMQPIAVEPQRPVVIATPRHRHRRANASLAGVQIEIERDFAHQPVGRAIILAADGWGLAGGTLDIEHLIA